VINALDAPVEAAWRELTKRTRPRRPSRPGSRSAPRPGHGPAGRRGQQITHAIRMAAYNAETSLARALDGHYARSGDEAYAVIREALAVSGDHPARRRRTAHPARTRSPHPAHPGPGALCDQLTAAGARIPAPTSSSLPGSNRTQALHKDLPMSGVRAWQRMAKMARRMGSTFLIAQACPGCDG